MTAKEYMRQYEYASRRAQRCRKEYEDEMLRIDAVRSLSDNDGMPHGTNISRPTEEKAIRLSLKAIEWKMAELEAIETRQQVFRIISEIDGIEGDVLFGRYIELRRWEDIARTLHYSTQNIFRIHGRALQLVAETMMREK